MGVLDSPPSLAATPGLALSLQNRGPQVIAGTSMNLSNCPYNNGPNNGIIILTSTTQMVVVPSFTGFGLVLVFGNYTNNSGGVGECPSGASPVIRASIASSSTATYGIPVKFKGERDINLPALNNLESDFIPFAFTAGVPFYIRTSQNIGGYDITHLGGYTTLGGMGSIALNNGEGYIQNANYADYGTITQQLSTDGYGPSAIMGFTPQKAKSVALLTDSIGFGTMDAGNGYNSGCWPMRAVAGVSSFLFSALFTPIFPFIMLGKGGETIGQFTANNFSNNLRRLDLAMHCSTILIQHGTNDIVGGITLAAFQAMYLAEVNFFLAAQKTVLVSTILPRPTTTDCLATITNQTLGSYESVRQGVNSWLRDTSSSGLIAQSNNPGKVKLIETCSAVEVNSAGVLTLNGGYWKPRTATAYYSGSATATPSSLTSLTCSGLAAIAQDALKGYFLVFTTGAAINTGADIFGNSGSALSLGSSSTGISSLWANGDTFQIFAPSTGGQLSLEATHPVTYGHYIIANSVMAAVQAAIN